MGNATTRERAAALLRAALEYVERASDEELAQDFADANEGGEPGEAGAFYDGEAGGDRARGSVEVRWTTGA